MADQPQQPADAAPLSNPASVKPPKKPRIWQRRWFKVLAAMATGVFIALAITTYNITRPRNLARLASGLLSGMTGTTVDIHSAYAGLDGTIHLTDVHLRIPDQEGPTGRFFDAKEVIITQDLPKLYRGKFSPKKIIVNEPTLYIIEDSKAEKYNYQILQQRLANPASTQPRQLPTVLPEVRISGGSVTFGEFADGKYSELGKLPVEGGLVADAKRAGVYGFSLAQRSSSNSGAVVSGTLDLNRFSVVGKLDRFSIESPQRVALPRRLQKWWDRLNPAGSLPTVSFGYDSDNGLGLYAVLELKEGEITLPWGDSEAAMTSRMTHVNGRFNLTLSSIQVENLTGNVEGLDYKLNGRIDGFDADAPLNLVVQIKEFNLPQQPKYLPALPQGIQNHFYRFTPSGTFKALVKLERKNRGEKITYDGNVNLSGVKASYARFPYPVTELRGELRFNDDRVEIVSMKGKGPTGANVSVTGVISPPREGAHISVRVEASDVPVDEYLRAAMSPDQAAIIDLIQDKPTYDGLVAKGLIQSTAQKKARGIRLLEMRRQLIELQSKQSDGKQAATQPSDELASLAAQVASLEAEAARPAFDLHCKASFVAEVDRPEGTNSKYSTTVYIQAAGTTMLLKQWPYPLQLDKGRVTVSGGRVLIEDVEAHGLSGATALVRGAIEPPREGKGRSPRIQFSVKNMPLDPLLRNTVPEPHDRWLRDLRLTGQIDCVGVLLRTPDSPPSSPIEFRFETALSKGHAQPFGGAYHIDDVAGKAIIERGKVTIESMAGRHGDTKISLSGESGTRVGESPAAASQPAVVLSEAASKIAPQTHFVVHAIGLRLQEPVLDMVPPDAPAAAMLRKVFEKHKPVGTADTQINIVTGGKETALTARLTPHDVKFDVDGRTIELTQCKGEIRVDRGVATFDQWSTNLGTGTVQLKGSVTLAENPVVNLVVNAKNQAICPATRQALPSGLVRFIEGISLAGGYELKNTTVVYTPPLPANAEANASNSTAEKAKTGLKIHGTARVQNANAAVGFKIRELAGDIDFDVTMATLRDKMPRMELNVDLQKFIAADRLVSPLKMTVVSGENPHELLIKDLAGDLYRGSIAGAGKVEVSEGGSYQLRLSISDADVGPIVYPLRYAEANGNPPPDAPDSNFEALRNAKISASLDLKGLVSDPEKRSGRGRFDVTDVNLNQSSLATAIIQMVNLTLPMGEAFNHASSSFLIENDNIDFEHIALDSPSFSFIGKGRMAYRAQTLDIDFLAQAKRKELVPLVAVWRLLLDQLINIHVSGTLAKPVAQLRPLEGVRRSVDDMLGQPAKGPAPRVIAPNGKTPIAPNPPIEEPIRGGS